MSDTEAKDTSATDHYDHHPDGRQSDEHDHSRGHEQRTCYVVFLTAVTMVVEIIFGYWTNSMALLADGLHMASHVFALGLTSITAIIALTLGIYYNLYSLDSISGIISSIVITKWSIDLMRGSGKDLIDFSRKQLK